MRNRHLLLDRLWLPLFHDKPKFWRSEAFHVPQFCFLGNQLSDRFVHYIFRMGYWITEKLSNVVWWYVARCHVGDPGSILGEAIAITRTKDRICRLLFLYSVTISVSLRNVHQVATGIVHWSYRNPFQTVSYNSRTPAYYYNLFSSHLVESN